jgi:hypothetical protein
MASEGFDPHGITMPLLLMARQYVTPAARAAMFVMEEGTFVTVDAVPHAATIPIVNTALVLVMLPELLVTMTL